MSPEYIIMNNSLREKLKTDLVLLDGAFGTYIQSFGLADADFRDKPGCMEYLAFTRADLIGKVHGDYLEAGSDAVETNTFGANAVKLAEYGLAGDVYDVNLTATRLARNVADDFSTSSRPRYVIGTMGPTGKLPSSLDPVLGNIAYDELKAIFRDQALGIIDGGADALLVETGQDLLEMKAAVSGAKEAMERKKKDLVLMAQCTLANNGRMLLGTEMSAVAAVMGYLGVDVVGLNCSTGPVEMEGVLRYLKDHCPVHVSCVPNAGLPVEVDGKAEYPMKPGQMADIMARFVKKYQLDVIGGCCGTNPEHIKHIREAIKSVKKREPAPGRLFASFYQGFDLDSIERPVKVGERINTQGSRKMKELLVNEDYDGIIELGKEQQRAGSEIIDVSCVLTERHTEKRDACLLTRRLAESVQVPLMVDSTDTAVIEEALRNYPGTAFINSANLEDGGEKARKIFSLAKEHASFVVNLVIDEKGMARDVERKLEIAGRLYDMAVKEYSLEPHRLLFDMLTFTLGTGEKEYRDSAVNIFEAIKRLKEKHPGILTVLGVSNISFGLRKEARRVINMVFLHHAVKAGLDMAIVNPAEYVEYGKIPAKDRKMAEDLIFNRDEEALHRLVEHFAAKKPAGPAVAGPGKKPAMRVEERLKRCVFDRDKTGIIPLVDEALKRIPPEEIINGVLMDAMKEVGERLDSGETVLPYVLQSAEVMRKAIEHLEDFIPKETVQKRGKVLLATVFGDVHDIGKNLVKMVLENNGFTVIDLGKQVPVDRIVEEAGKNKVDAVGLSALLVSTARHMKTCVQSMHDAGLEYPLILGGAPVNERFAKEASALDDESVYRGGVFYARDAFTGLKIMQALMDSGKRKEAMDAYFRHTEKEIAGHEKAPAGMKRPSGKAPAEVPAAPFYGVRPLSSIPADEVFDLLDERALFESSWGAKLKDGKEKRRVIEKEFRPLLAELKEESLRKGWLDLKAVYGYFSCRVKDEEMGVVDESGKVLETFHLERSKDEKALALTDYFAPRDVVAFQAVTVGDKINDAIGGLNEEKEFTRAFFLHGLSVHLAEALAEYVHGKIREELKLKKAQGKRYSPGYPLWKDLEDQVKLFRLLDVERRLGIHLTEAFQMVPEQSTTAMIVHNDKAEY